MSRAAGSLVVTLRRGLAGKRASEISTAWALRLRRPGQCAEHPNTEAVRGQINKARICGCTRRERRSPNVTAARTHSCGTSCRWSSSLRTTHAWLRRLLAPRRARRSWLSTRQPRAAERWPQ